jgi:hypothetical protein
MADWKALAKLEDASDELHRETETGPRRPAAQFSQKSGAHPVERNVTGVCIARRLPVKGLGRLPLADHVRRPARSESH